jgi:hypothetical protein
MDTLPYQLVLALGAVLGIEALKKAGWFPLVGPGKESINKVFAVLVAAAAATGIAWSSAFDASAGTLTVTVTGLTSASIYKGLWAFIQQWIWQQGAWKMLKERLT